MSRVTVYELESSPLLSLYRLCVSIPDTRQEIKIESRSRRVLTILGRLSSDLQPIVNPPPSPSLPTLAAFPPSLRSSPVASSSAATARPRVF